MNARFDLIVFDWDGTLMDSEAHIVDCMQQACRDLELAVLPQEMVRNVIGLGLSEAVQALLPGAGPDQVARFADRYRHHFLSTADEMAVFFPGAQRTLDRLESAGFLLGVATGKSRRGLDRVLASTGLTDRFHATRCADETFSKPHPEMLLQIMDRLGVEPARTLMVGDTEYDLEMASGAGAASVGVSYGVHDPERLSRHGPLAIFDDISELPVWLGV